MYVFQRCFIHKSNKNKENNLLYQNLYVVLYEIQVIYEIQNILYEVQVLYEKQVSDENLFSTLNKSVIKCMRSGHFPWHSGKSSTSEISKLLVQILKESTLGQSSDAMLINQLPNNDISFIIVWGGGGEECFYNTDTDWHPDNSYDNGLHVEDAPVSLYRVIRSLEWYTASC